MKKIAVVFWFFTSFYTFAQDNTTQPNKEVIELSKNSFWDHVRFGGGLGFGFGNNSTTINVSPSAIYDFENGFALGASVGYLYSQIQSFKSNVISPGIVALYNPAQEIQLSAEFEYLFVSQKFSGFDATNFDYPALYLGVAYRTGWAAFGVRYDVLFDANDSIFSSAFSPVIRVYF